MHSIWRDSSEFNDTYNEVHLVKTVEHSILAKLLEEKSIRVSPFANRLLTADPPLRLVTELADFLKLYWQLPSLKIDDHFLIVVVLSWNTSLFHGFHLEDKVYFNRIGVDTSISLISL